MQIKAETSRAPYVRLSNLPTYPLDRLSRYEEPRCGASVSDSVHATVSRPPQAMGEAWVATSSRLLKYVRSGTNCVENSKTSIAIEQNSRQGRFA